MKSALMAITLCMLIVLGFISPAFSAVFSVTQITNNSYDDVSPVIAKNGDIAWVANGEIFVYVASNGTVTRLTSNTVSDDSPQINDVGDVVWVQWSQPSTGHNAIMRYTKATNTIIRLNPDNPLVQDWSDLPQINNLGHAVWASHDGTDY